MSGWVGGWMNRWVSGGFGVELTKCNELRTGSPLIRCFRNCSIFLRKISSKAAKTVSEVELVFFFIWMD